MGEYYVFFIWKRTFFLRLNQFVKMIFLSVNESKTVVVNLLGPYENVYSYLQFLLCFSAPKSLKI